MIVRRIIYRGLNGSMRIVRAGAETHWMVPLTTFTDLEGIFESSDGLHGLLVELHLARVLLHRVFLGGLGLLPLLDVTLELGNLSLKALATSPGLHTLTHL